MTTYINHAKILKAMLDEGIPIESLSVYLDDAIKQIDSLNDKHKIDVTFGYAKIKEIDPVFVIV